MAKAETKPAPLSDIDAIKAKAKAENRELTGLEVAEVLSLGEQFTITARNKKNPKESDFVMLACINGVKYWANPGQTKSVPMEVARIAYRAGEAVGMAPALALGQR